jgi:hypothetical protein
MMPINFPRVVSSWASEARAPKKTTKKTTINKRTEELAKMGKEDLANRRDLGGSGKNQGFVSGHRFSDAARGFVSGHRFSDAARG